MHPRLGLQIKYMRLRAKMDKEKRFTKRFVAMQIPSNHLSDGFLSIHMLATGQG